MNLTDCLLCLWPGLPKLWLRASLRSMLLAVLFAIALNLALIHTFLWPQWLPLLSPYLMWPMLALVWTFSAWTGLRQIPDLLLLPPEVQTVAGEPDFLAEAQLEYLRGHYAEAELLLKRQLHRHADDIPAGLMLGTLYRHQGRLRDARSQLSGLSKWDSSLRWRFEIDRELDAIKELLEAAETMMEEQPTTESTPIAA